MIFTEILSWNSYISAIKLNAKFYFLTYWFIFLSGINFCINHQSKFLIADYKCDFDSVSIKPSFIISAISQFI